jgi:hypothetical protein
MQHRTCIYTCMPSPWRAGVARPVAEGAWTASARSARSISAAGAPPSAGAGALACPGLGPLPPGVRAAGSECEWGGGGTQSLRCDPLRDAWTAVPQGESGEAAKGVRNPLVDTPSAEPCAAVGACGALALALALAKGDGGDQLRLRRARSPSAPRDRASALHLSTWRRACPTRRALPGVPY